jgi:hypothetical protein
VPTSSGLLQISRLQIFIRKKRTKGLCLSEKGLWRKSDELPEKISATLGNETEQFIDLLHTETQTSK